MLLTGPISQTSMDFVEIFNILLDLSSINSDCFNGCEGRQEPSLIFFVMDTVQLDFGSRTTELGL